MKHCPHLFVWPVRVMRVHGVEQHVQIRGCCDCGEWLSLGPAVVRDEYQTQIELLIAEHIADICQLWEPKDQDEKIEEMLEQTLAFDAFMSMTVAEAKERYGLKAVAR